MRCRNIYLSSTDGLYPIFPPATTRHSGAARQCFCSPKLLIWGLWLASCATCAPTTLSFLGGHKKLFIFYMLFFIFASALPGASHCPVASRCFCSPEHVTWDVWLASHPTPTTATKSIFGKGNDLFLLQMPILYYHPTLNSQPSSSCPSAVLVSAACYPAMTGCTMPYSDPYT